jgi:hypothetical protein
MREVELPEGMTHYVYATDEYKLEHVIHTSDITACSFMKIAYDIDTWTLVGFAKIETQTLNEREMKLQAIESLDEQIKSIQAQTENKLTELRNKKQQLLAITMDT